MTYWPFRPISVAEFAGLSIIKVMIILLGSYISRYFDVFPAAAGFHIPPYHYDVTNREVENFLLSKSEILSTPVCRNN